MDAHDGPTRLQNGLPPKGGKLSSHYSGDEVLLDLPSTSDLPEAPGEWHRDGAAHESSFWHAREVRLGILSMALLIFQGTALSLTLRYSRCVASPPCLLHVAVTTYLSLVSKSILASCNGAKKAVSSTHV